MTQKEKKEIAAWLDERRDIVQEQMEVLGAHLAFVPRTGHWEIIVQSKNGKTTTMLWEDDERRETLTGRCALVNHAYYNGAMDALHMAGIHVNEREGKHNIW